MLRQTGLHRPAVFTGSGDLGARPSLRADPRRGILVICGCEVTGSTKSSQLERVWAGAGGVVAVAGAAWLALEMFTDDPRQSVKTVGRELWTNRYPGWHLWALVAMVLGSAGFIVLDRRNRSLVHPSLPTLQPGDSEIVGRYVHRLEGEGMRLLREHHFGARFFTEPINEMYYAAVKLYSVPENKLVDGKLASTLDEFATALGEFFGYMGLHTIPVHGGAQSVYPQDYVYTPELDHKYEEESAELNRLSVKAATSFDAFVTAARQRGWTKL